MTLLETLRALDLTCHLRLHPWDVYDLKTTGKLEFNSGLGDFVRTGSGWLVTIESVDPGPFRVEDWEADRVLAVLR